MDLDYVFNDPEIDVENLDDHIFLLDSPVSSCKRRTNESSFFGEIPVSKTTCLSFPDKVLGQQIKEKTQTNVISKKTSVYLSAIMEGIAKYVLEMAGQGKEEFILPESRCIRVEDVEKVLTNVGLPEVDANTNSRYYLRGASVCIDSISVSRVEQTCQTMKSYLNDFVEIQQLLVEPSPLLQDYMLSQPSIDDGVTITTYCERVSTFLAIQPKTEQFVIIPRSLRLLLSICQARGQTRQHGLLLLRDYINHFNETVTISVDIYLDSDENASFYTQYNNYRRDQTNRLFTSNSFKLETEQLVFYKIIRDILKGKWIVIIPRYCQMEGWEYEQMIKTALNRVESFIKCSISIVFSTKAIKHENAIVYSNATNIMDKYKSLKRYSYPSPWNGESCIEKNQTIYCNIGLLCLCPIEVIPVLYHHLYYQCSIVLFTTYPENHLSIKNILELIRNTSI